MARAARVDIGGQIYHVMNRAVGRLQIFNTDEDYLTFLNILREAGETSVVEVLAYCCMPNHWHLVLRTKADGDLGKYMQAHQCTYPFCTYKNTNCWNWTSLPGKIQIIHG